MLFRVYHPSRREVIAQAALLWAGVAVTVVVIGWTDVRRIGRGETGDFVHFYAAADAVLHGCDPYAAGTRGYIYPPPPAFAAQPLALVSIGTAAGVMLAVNVAVTIATLALLAGEFLRRFDAPRRDAAAVAAVALTGLLLDVDKVKGEWQMWQTDVWVLLGFAVALRWVDRRPIRAGIALGVGANLKYLHLLMVPYLLVRRRWAAAASTVATAGVVAVLPAAQVGWATLGRYWATAARGIAGMGAVPVGGERAEVHALTDALSCSVTSAIGRGLERFGTGSALAVTAVVGAGLMVAAVALYRRRGVAVVGPTSAAVTGVEWAAAVAVLLAFSPQTNTRHLYDALIVTTAAAALLASRPAGRARWPLAVGVAVMAAAFAFPLGHRTVNTAGGAAHQWLRLGGPCWGLLVAAGALLWAGVRPGSSGVPSDAGLAASGDGDGRVGGHGHVLGRG